MATSSYMMPDEHFKSAEECWQNPPITAGEVLADKRNSPVRKTGHLDYMDFCEIYADYVVAYEKTNHDRQHTAQQTGFDRVNEACEIDQLRAEVVELRKKVAVAP